MEARQQISVFSHGKDMLQPITAFKEKLYTEEYDSFRRVIGTIAATTISNTAGLAAGHPLDTIRIRMQMDNRRITMKHCLYDAISKEGIMSLYKGLLTPVLGAIPVCSIVFVVTEETKRALRQQNPEMSL